MFYEARRLKILKACFAGAALGLVVLAFAPELGSVAVFGGAFWAGVAAWLWLWSRGK